MDIAEILLPNNEPKRPWELGVPVVKQGNQLDVYLTDDIVDPSVYDELRYILQNAEAHHTIYIHITSGGGGLDSAIALINAIRSTQAYTIAVPTAVVASAATMITLACQEVQVTDHLRFMVHNYSTHGLSGKGNELKEQQKFMDQFIESFMKDIYEGFLTPKEIDEMIDGKDFWMGTTEVEQRLAGTFHSEEVDADE